MTQTPAGWYPDGHGSQRWWDGSQWTEHTMPASGGAPDASSDDSSGASSGAPVDPHSEPTRVAGSSPLPSSGQPGSQPGSQPPGAPPSAPPAGTPYGGAPAAPGYGAPSTPGYGAPAAPGGYPQQGGYPPAGGGYPGQGFGQGYPQQGGYPGQQKKGLSGKVIGLIGGGVLAVIIVVVLLVVLLGGGGHGNSPKGAVQDLLDGVKDKDCGKIQDATTDSFFNDSFGGIDQCKSDASSADSSSSDAPDLKDATISVGDATENGDSATVPVTISIQGQNVTETFTTQKVDGDWKVDSEDTAGVPDSSSIPTPSMPDIPTPSGF